VALRLFINIECNWLQVEESSHYLVDAKLMAERGLSRRGELLASAWGIGRRIAKLAHLVLLEGGHTSGGLSLAVVGPLTIAWNC
jgi:hypothetical protein